MSIQFITAVNETLKRVGLIAGPDEELDSFEDSNRQPSIDRILQIWNEVLRFYYNTATEPFPTELKQSTITLVDQQREYDLPTDMDRLNWPLINETNGQWIREFAGGFERMRIVQTQPQNWTGRPIWAVINPINSKLRMYSIPQSDDAGDVYQLYYEKRVSLKFTNDTFPFSDTIVEQLYPAVASIFRDDKGEGTNGAGARQALGVALSLGSKEKLRSRY